MTRRIGPILLCALLLAACGGQENQTSQESTSSTVTAPDATTTTTGPTTTTTTTQLPTTTTTYSGESGAESLLSSLNASTEITSARIEGSMEMRGIDDSMTGVSEAVLYFSSSFDTTTGDSSFLMDMSSFLGAMEPDDGDPFGELFTMFGEMELREIGDTTYMRFPLFTSMLGAETEWVSMPAEEGDVWANDIEFVPADPNEVIAPFDHQAASVEVVGIETVNGVEATHYRALLDPETMEFTPEEQAELADRGMLATGEIAMDIWISDDGYMVRMVMEIDGAGLDAPPDEQFDSMTLRYDVFEINSHIAIEPPPASQVTPLEDLEAIFGFGQ